MGSQDCRIDTISTFVLVRKSNPEKYTNWRNRDEEKNCNWWFTENDPQQGDLIGAVYEGIAEFLNGLDEDTRAEVLYDTCLKNVIEPGEDEQGRDLHTTFD